MSHPPPAYSASWSTPIGRSTSPTRQATRFAIVLAVHVALIWGVLELASRPEVRQVAQELMVRLIEPPAPEPEVKPPEIVPPKPTPKPVRKPDPTPRPEPIITAAPEAPAPAETFTAPPQPPAPPVVEAPPAPPAVTLARFDADYLSNPKPVYPVASRRLGEEGKVFLRVKVSPGGTALAVEVKQSCGFSRLDAAAKSAVERWRFVPARRGAEAIESWVTVPIVFSLQAS